MNLCSLPLCLHYMTAYTCQWVKGTPQNDNSAIILIIKQVELHIGFHFMGTPKAISRMLHILKHSSGSILRNKLWPGLLYHYRQMNKQTVGGRLSPRKVSGRFLVHISMSYNK